MVSMADAGNKEKNKELFSTFFLIIVFSKTEPRFPTLTSYYSVICSCIVVLSTRIQMELMGLITQPCLLLCLMMMFFPRLIVSSGLQIISVLLQ